MKRILLFIIISIFCLNAEVLFEIKDQNDSTVFQIADDGLRVFNLGDTLMVISASSIRANISDGKGRGLSRSFSVTTSASKKSGNIDVLEITTDESKMREGVEGSQYTDFSPENIFLGLNSGSNTIPNGIEGINNVFLGNESGIVNGSGNSNVFIGYNSGNSNTSGSSNVFVGNEAGTMNTTSSFITYVGTHAGRVSTGAGNTFVGYATGYDNTTAYHNSFFGERAGANNTTGLYNNYFGYYAGVNNTTGTSNCAFGNRAGAGSPGAVYDYNCLFGNYAGSQLDSASSNIMIGYYSGYGTDYGSQNIFIGERSGYSNTSGYGNIFIGNRAGYYQEGSNKLFIDNSDTNWPLVFGKFDFPRQVVIDGNDGDNGNDRKFFVYGTAGGTSSWYNDSDKRKKKNIKTIDSSLDKVSKLRGVTFEWDAGEKYETGRQMGFIAQEAEKVIPEVVDYNVENDSYGMQYAPITALLIEAVKELKSENESLRRELEEIKSKIDR
ncbi:MAG: tail fiber domain-containing protein [Candidatus Delongbacteria bacterium]|nr:tail fiber domain-containing protein [Candidatus Delongbacteria bacterium]